jgi:hypothetical protein
MRTKDIFTPAKNILHKTFIALHAAETPRNYDIYQVKAFNQYLNFTVTKNMCFSSDSIHGLSNLIYYIPV